MIHYPMMMKVQLNQSTVSPYPISLLVLETFVSGKEGDYYTETTEYIDVSWIGNPITHVGDTEVLVKHTSLFDSYDLLGGTWNTHGIVVDIRYHQTSP